MSIRIILLQISFFILLCGCKPNHRNAEPKIMLSFFSADSSTVLKNNFDVVYGIKNGQAHKTLYPDTSSNKVYLPLDIKEDSSAFVFVREGSRDTISINYRTRIKDRDYYDVEATRITPGYSTFDSIQVICSNKECAHAEELFIYD